MPLPLTDSRWNELNGSYGGAEDVLRWLTDAYTRGGLSNERLGDLINEVQHQGDTSAAMYAVAGHLIELARRSPPREALSLLTHAGIMHAESNRPGAISCPTFLREDFAASASEGIKLLPALLPLSSDFDSYKWAVAGLAGFMGQHQFARFLEGLDFYEGQFYHNSHEGPLSSDE